MLTKQPDWSRLTLEALLSQPVPLLQGAQSPGNAINVTFASHSALLEASQFHLDKLRGYLGLRATVTFRLVVNADKFTMGRLVLSYQPSNVYYLERRSDYRHVSQLEHVELDLNTDTEAALSIPHRGPYTHFDLTNKKYDTGFFRITEYLLHRGNPYSWTIYASFSDIDLLGPTAVTTVAYQGNLEIEEKKEPISSKLAQLSSVATSFAAVPVLTSIMAPLAWASAVGSNVLSAFGYSRPSTTITPTVYVKRSAAKLNQTDGTDYADQMAMTTTAATMITDEIGLTKNDEMSFAYLCGINAAVFRFNTSTTTTVGTRILSFPLAPYMMKGRADVTSAVIMHPMAYIANLFNKYRGSLSVTLDFAKTVFHSGRYLAVFEPINPEGVTFPTSRVNTIQDAINCHKDIVDIRKGTTFTVDLPFTSVVPYLSTERPYGYFHLFVLNALVTENPTVPGIISVGVKVKALEDMEFCCPTDPRYSPYLPQDGTVTVGLGAGRLPATLDGVTYQSGLELGDSMIINKSIGSSTKPTATTDYAAMCIGEKILSMKQVALRSKLIRVANGTLRDNQDIFAVDTFYDTEWAAIPNTNIDFKQWFDYYSYVGRMYEYVRGGINLTIHNQDATQQIVVGVRTDARFFSDIQPESPYNEFALQHLIEPAGVDRIYIPQYTNSYVRYALPTFQQDRGNALPNVTDFGWDSGVTQTSLTVYGISSGLPIDGLKLWRSGADDTQFGGFKGTPYMILREPYNGEVDYKSENYFFPLT